MQFHQAVFMFDPRPQSFCIALLLLGGLSICLQPARAQERVGLERAMPGQALSNGPNVLLIMIDDLGWMDLACQGNQLVETPNIDRLARQGMQFTDAYAAAPVCSPTRAAIMTGLSPARLAITNHIPDREAFLPDNATLAAAPMLDRLGHEYVTIAEHVHEAGYATGFVGKWHLAAHGDPDYFPEHHGFDLNVGGCALGGPPTFFDPYRIPTLSDRRPGEYLPDRLADESIDFIRQHADQKFMLFLWPYTVHWPMEAPEALLQKYASRTGPGLNDTRYGAMIEAMDTAMGRVLAELDRLELAANTLVIFTSDNGGYGGVSDCRPLRASKGYLYEGGIRVPLIVRWPGVIGESTTCATPVISMDFFPTIIEAAGVPTGDTIPSDGLSLLPLFRGEAALKRSSIYFHYPNYAWHKSNRLAGAIRRGELKLIEHYDDGSVELYNLSQDLGETRDLSAAMSAEAEALRAELVNWRMTVNARMPTKIER